MEDQSRDGVDRFGSPLAASQDQAEQQPEASRDAGHKGASPTQSIEDKTSQLSDVAKTVLRATSQPASTPILATRPPHSGWEPTTINMAKCDYCDKRRRGTLHRCIQCQIAICKACCASGILDHDSRHALDVDAVDWELHPKERTGKKPKKASAAAARGGNRFKARGGRANKADLSQAATAEADESSQDQPQDEIVVATPSVMELQEQGEQTQTSLGGLVPLRSASVQEDNGLYPAAYREVTQDQHQARNQHPVNYIEVRQPLLARSQYIDPPMGVRHIPQTMSTPHQDAGYSTPSCDSPVPRLCQVRTTHYQPDNANASSPPVYRNQGHRGSGYAGTYETYLANRDKVFRHHPYRPPPSTEESPSARYEYHPRAASASEQQEANRGLHRYPPQHPPSTSPEQAYDQGRFPPASNINSRTSPPLFSWDPQIPFHHQPAFSHEARIFLPPIQELEKPPPALRQSQPQRLTPEPLIHRLGSQLESDALATQQDYSAWPLDECLRHEVARVWSRRNAPVGLLRDLLPSGAGDGDVDDAFRVLLGATYFATIRLRLEVQNAARRWLVETERQLCADKLMEPVRANHSHDRP